MDQDEDLAPHRCACLRLRVVRGGSGVDDGPMNGAIGFGPAYCLIDRFNVFSTLATFETRRPEWPFR